MDEIRKQKEQNIDKLLVMLNDQIEEAGEVINCANFSFSQPDSELIEYFGSEEMLKATVLTCVSRGFLKRKYLGCGDYDGLFLTEEGQCRAISVINQKSQDCSVTAINIGQITNNGPTQIGNNNVQNITNILTQLMEQVDKTTASEEEKKDFKAKVNALLSHPLINTVIAAGAGIAGSLL